MYPYGLIGNCQASALISRTGSVDWLCLPRPDSEPVFGRLLDPRGGHFSIEFADGPAVATAQRYVENTNILITEMTDGAGAKFRITDFCPRFHQFGRMYRPNALFRIVEPLSGAPMIRADCRPVEGWSKVEPRAARGNSHLNFEVRGDSLRLHTNMPMTYLTGAAPCLLKHKIYFALTWGSSLEEDLASVSERYLKSTEEYWQTWVKHCSIPTAFQTDVIRSALALKLHVFEDTGAILAALTTSLPEELGSERNWDYRFCWLRDSYFVLSAFHNLGMFEEMEGFLTFLLGIAQRRKSDHERLAPVYTLSQDLPLPETIHVEWAGHKGSGPVRSLNQAAEHVQNDVYGEMVLTIAPIYFDERFRQLRTPQHEALILHLGRLCAETISVPDAGLWEVREGWQEHTFSNLMCWAGLERIERMQALGVVTKNGLDASAGRKKAEAAVNAAIKNGVVRNGPKDDSLDSALALMSVLRFPDESVASKTLDEIRRTLAADGDQGAYLYRYLRNDDFGTPHSAFVICSFWVAQGLSNLGREREARQILETLRESANEVGLYAEHFEPKSKTQLGNFPQAYSHVGLINAAFAASAPWSQIV